MTQQLIVTTPHNSGAGDPAFTAFEKCNSNFTELYTSATIVTLTAGLANAASNAAAIMNAAAQNTTAILPPGTYYVGPMIFSVGGFQLQGTGVFSTELIFVPIGNSTVPSATNGVDPGTCIQFCNLGGQSILFNCSLKNLAIQTADTTFTKCAVRLCETSQFVLQDVLIQTFLGGDSVGVQTMGHELLTVNRLDSQACIPLRISNGLKAYGNTVTGISATNTAGAFSCTATTLQVGWQMTFYGTLGGTGSISGYSNPTTYAISATNGSTTFTLTTQAGAAITTTVGTITGGTVTAGVIFVDHFHFHDLYLQTGSGSGNTKNQAAQWYPATLSHGCVLLDDNLVVTNMAFDGRQAWVGGQYGFYNATTQWGGGISNNWSFKNVRKEQGYSNSQLCNFNNTSSSTLNLRQMLWENCYNTEGYTGWFVQGMYFLTIINCMSPSQSSFFVVQAGTNVQGLEFRNVWFNPSDLLSLNANLANPINATYYSGYKWPASASWLAGGYPITGQQRDIITGPTTGFSYTIPNTVTAFVLDPSGTLASGTVTLCAAPTDNQEVTVSVSQIITSFTVSPNTGQTVRGAPSASTFGPGGMRYIYQSSNTTWYRIN